MARGEQKEEERRPLGRERPLHKNKLLHMYKKNKKKDKNNIEKKQK